MRLRLFVLMFVLLAGSAAAQQLPTASDDPVATAPIRIGPLGFDPRFGLNGVGIDTNVFNTTDNRQRDFTFTLAPGADLWLRTGRGLLTVSGGAEYSHFQRFGSQRSLTSHVVGQYEFAFNRMRPYASAGSLSSRQRPGFEIDARARHYETRLQAGIDLRIMSKSTVRAEVRQLKVSFAGDEFYEGTRLSHELNRTETIAELSWRQRLTALTTWITQVSHETDRFEFGTARNANSFRLASGFELGRFALIRGRAFAGYRKLAPADGGTVPEFSGVVADVNVSYTAPTQTRLGVAAERDVRYSFDVTTPYYIQTGWTATLTQRIIGRWDGQLSGGRDRLSYQASSEANRRTDFIGRFGGGIGYTVGDQVRASFDVNSFYRSSEISGREYGGIRAGFSVTYGY
jgi:hypothetical protein